MNFIEPFEYAPEWIKKLAMKSTAFPKKKPKAIAFFKMYEGMKWGDNPAFRDRTAEYERMLPALAEIEPGAQIVEAFTATGSQIYRMDVDFPGQGAQFMYTYRLLMI